jgi:hypothetical protein
VQRGISTVAILIFDNQGVLNDDVVGILLNSRKTKEATPLNPLIQKTGRGGNMFKLAPFSFFRKRRIGVEVFTSKTQFNF